MRISFNAFCCALDAINVQLDLKWSKEKKPESTRKIVHSNILIWGSSKTIAYIESRSKMIHLIEIERKKTTRSGAMQIDDEIITKRIIRNRKMFSYSRDATRNGEKESENRLHNLMRIRFSDINGSNQNHLKSYFTGWMHWNDLKSMAWYVLQCNFNSLHIVMHLWPITRGISPKKEETEHSLGTRARSWRVPFGVKLLDNQMNAKNLAYSKRFASI